MLVVTLYYSLVTIISLPTELKLKMQHLDKMTTLEIKHKNILFKKTIKLKSSSKILAIYNLFMTTNDNYKGNFGGLRTTTNT